MDKRVFKDRDFIRTPEDLFFCVVGYLHPKDRAISYLRYIPSSNGKWGHGSKRYARAMPSYTITYLLKNIEALGKDSSEYVFYSDVLNTQMSAVPYTRIEEHYRPERRLDGILKLEKPDELQEKVIELVALISNTSGVSPRYTGVTGSILINIHRPEFSDIDLVVFGKDNSIKVKDALLSIYDGKESIVQKLHGDALHKWCEEKARDYPLTFEETKRIYSRKWNYGLFKDTNFSVHPVRLDSEITEIYGDRIFSAMGMVKIRAMVSDTSESIFLPHTYTLNRVIVEEGKEVEDIKKVVTYEGLYGSIFEVDDEIYIKGRLEKVLDKRTGEVYHQIVVGSLEGKGTDCIKLYSH